MGRTAKPAALKLLEGRGDGRDSGGRTVTTGPGFRRVPPAKPGWLSPEASAEWDRVVPELQRLELLSSVQQAPLAAYCESVSRHRAACEALRHQGLTIEAKQGELPNPLVGIVRQEAAAILKFAAHWGLTASTEQQVAREASDADEESNPFGGSAAG